MKAKGRHRLRAERTGLAPLWWNALSSASETWWTRSAGSAAIAAVAERRSLDLVRFARANSRFYGDAWASLPKRDLALRDLPVVTKRQLMAHFDDWVTDRAIDRRTVDGFLADRSHVGEQLLGRYVVWKSSGSTGEPGIFVQDSIALSTYDALLVVQLQALWVASRYAFGVLSQGGRAALVAATGDHFASIASWKRLCRSSAWLDARAFSVMEPTPALVEALNDYRPAFLASYPTTLAMLANEQLAGRLRIAPACLWSGGEHLSVATRELIERAFNAVVVNEYGASECMSIGFSCPSGTLHVNADWVVLEPVDRDYRPGQLGEPSHTVLLTNLANRVQPIIRYDLGDSVTMRATACECGSPLPAIRVEGRRDDPISLRADDGRTVELSPLALTTVIEDAIGGSRFQLVQTSADSIAVRLAAQDPRERRSEWVNVKPALHAYLVRQSLGNVRLELDAQLPVPDVRSGKLREVVGELSFPSPRVPS